MRNLVLTILLAVCSVAVQAQKDVTKFLGIPVDGTKPAMIQKLKAKGFSYDESNGVLVGNFNGRKVSLHILTDKGDKVWRIAVFDYNCCDESAIKIRFNTLCKQFSDNEKYYPAEKEGYELSDEEDISYEMTVHKKRYQATFYQRVEMDSATITKETRPLLLKKYTQEQIDNPTREQIADMAYIQAKYVIDSYFKRIVWFMIAKGVRYGEYEICMFYDNEYNHSNGEDL